MARTITKTSTTLKNLSDTTLLGKEVAATLKKNDVVAFIGDVGAGKTTLIKAIVSSLGFPEDEVTSPTFTYLNIYQTKIPIFHFDLYRMSNKNDFLAKGFDEYFFQNGICLIEWSEKIPTLIPSNAKKITLECLSNGERLCKIQ